MTIEELEKKIAADKVTITRCEYEDLKDMIFGLFNDLSELHAAYKRDTGGDFYGHGRYADWWGYAHEIGPGGDFIGLSEFLREKGVAK